MEKKSHCVIGMLILLCMYVCLFVLYKCVFWGSAGGDDLSISLSKAVCGQHVLPTRPACAINETKKRLSGVLLCVRSHACVPSSYAFVYTAK